ncbi:hypothetical protein ACHAXS_001489 [Conticribra weissflogii]
MGDLDAPLSELSDTLKKSNDKIIENQMKKFAEEMSDETKITPTNVNECAMSQQNQQPYRPTKKTAQNPYEFLSVVQSMLKCKSKLDLFNEV